MLLSAAPELHKKWQHAPLGAVCAAGGGDAASAAAAAAAAEPIDIGPNGPALPGPSPAGSPGRRGHPGSRSLKGPGFDTLHRRGTEASGPRCHWGMG